MKLSEYYRRDGAIPIKRYGGAHTLMDLYALEEGYLARDPRYRNLRGKPIPLKYFNGYTARRNLWVELQFYAGRGYMLSRLAHHLYIDKLMDLTHEI